MNTPAHLIFGLAAFAKPDAQRVTLAAGMGALLPDLSLYLLAGTSLFVLGIPAETVFGELYFSESWQLIFRIDNSFILWGLGLCAALWWRSDWGTALTGAALLHLSLDFPLHHDDGRAHFWPLTDWIFQSPFSYWDRDHYADVIGPIEMVASAILCAVLWRRFRTLWSRIGILALACAQILPTFIWMFVFDT